MQFFTRLKNPPNGVAHCLIYQKQGALSILFAYFRLVFPCFFDEKNASEAAFRSAFFISHNILYVMPFAYTIEGLFLPFSFALP